MLRDNHAFVLLLQLFEREFPLRIELFFPFHLLRFRIRSTMFSLILLHLFIVFERLKVRVALVLERAFLVRHGAFMCCCLCARISC